MSDQALERGATRVVHNSCVRGLASEQFLSGTSADINRPFQCHAGTGSGRLVAGN